MLSWIKRYLGFEAQTVDNLLRNFSKTINSLVKHAEDKAKELEEITADIIKLEDDRQDAATEAARAETIAAKIKALLSA